MDAFAVSVCKGLGMRRPNVRVALVLALLFGLFQAGMPVVGWLLGSQFIGLIEPIDHWIVFGLLGFIGGKMIWETFNGDEEHQTFNPLSLRTQLLLAVATSIDALAVGISMACLGYDRIGELTVPLLLIGSVSMLLSLVGYWLGVRFGRAIAQRFKPGLLGGLVLLFIGIKVLISHLFS